MHTEKCNASVKPYIGMINTGFTVIVTSEEEGEE